jgi:hypothetical protein
MRCLRLSRLERCAAALLGLVLVATAKSTPASTEIPTRTPMWVAPRVTRGRPMNWSTKREASPEEAEGYPYRFPHRFTAAKT